MSAVSRPFKWFYREFGIASIQQSGRNAYIIILARTCRMFAFGVNSLILAIFLSALNYSDHQIGAFMTLTLLGDVFLGTLVTLVADKLGRRRVLMGGSLLMIFSGFVFAYVENFWILLFAATLGVISVTGGDFGPFRSIEESILTQLAAPSTRADVLSWYVVFSTLGSALGAEASGRIVHVLSHREGWTSLDAYHSMFWVYAAMGVVNAVLTLLMTESAELHMQEKAYSRVPQEEEAEASRQRQSSPLTQQQPIEGPQSGWQKTKTWLGGTLIRISGPTRSTMFKLWLLLAVDSLADGMVPYSLTNYYMDLKFHPSKSTLGDLQSVSYFLGAISSTFAGPLARKIGLINTMVFTHIPSSMAVFFFAFPKQFWLTGVLLLIRSGMNPLDQAPRAAFIAAVVLPEERTAVMGITAMVRTLASTIGPSVTGVLAANNQFWIAFVAAGAFRLAYDFGLWALFVNMKINQNDNGADEARSSNGSTRHSRDEEEPLEMDSLVDPDDIDSSDDRGKLVSNETRTTSGLQISQTLERIRSRSPQRPVNHSAL